MHTDTYEAFMLDHCVGSLPPGLDMAASLHATLSARGARVANFWDVVGGVLLESADKSPPRLAKSARAAAARCEKTVRTLLETDLDALAWKPTLSGADKAPTGVRGTHFMRLRPGKSVPAHGHSAVEAVVVLQGQLEVDGQGYELGDMMIGIPGETHKPRAGGQDICICFVARAPRPFWRLT